MRLIQNKSQFQKCQGISQLLPDSEKCPRIAPTSVFARYQFCHRNNGDTYCTFVFLTPLKKGELAPDLCCSLPQKRVHCIGYKLTCNRTTAVEYYHKIRNPAMGVDTDIRDRNCWLHSSLVSLLESCLPQDERTVDEVRLCQKLCTGTNLCAAKNPTPPSDPLHCGPLSSG